MAACDIINMSKVSFQHLPHAVTYDIQKVKEKGCGLSSHEYCNSASSKYCP